MRICTSFEIQRKLCVWHDGVRQLARAGLFLGLALLVGCVDNTKQFRSDLSKLERGLSDIRNLQVEHTSRLATIEAEARSVSGRVDELEYRQTQKFGSDLSSMREDLSDLQRRTPPHPIVPGEALEVDERLVESLPPEISGLFRNALLKIREGKFSEAEPLLQEAYNLSFGTEWAANIIFWFAVTHDGKGDNRKALGAYNDFITKYPKHERTPLALLRQASVFIRLKDTKAARLTLSKLVAEFPKSLEAVRAKDRLREI